MQTETTGTGAEGRIAQAFTDLRSGQLDRARAVFAELMHDPQHGVDGYRGLAAVAWKQQQADTAIQLLRMAVQQQPDHADAQADLALVLLTAGRAQESLPHWDQRLRVRPTDAAAWHNYGTALVAVGHLDSAATAFEQALSLDPEQTRTYESFARALRETDPARAEAVWRRGVARLPKQESLHIGLIEALFEGGRLDACLAAYRAGIAELPDSANLQMGLGQILEDLGDKAGAEAQFRKALELQPGWAIPIEALLMLLRKDARDEDVAAAQAVLSDPLRPPADHANAAFGLGKVLDSRGDHDGAFAAWRQANAARRQQIGAFDREALVRRVDRLIAVFTKAFLAARRGWGHDSRRPLFVLGMPRSGTSLVEQILAAHPEVHGYGELTEISRISRALPQRAGTMQRWPEAAAALRPDLVRWAAEDYLAALHRRHPTQAARLVDKAPPNFFHIGLIVLMFPAARIVWCRRDPRDIGVSIYSENFGLTQKHATDLGDIGFFYRQHQRLMRHWAEVAGTQIHECRYEDLIAEPEAQTRRLVDAMGLPWDERCLRFHEGDRPVLTPSRWQVRSPIYGAAVGRWRRYEAHLGPLLQELAGELDG